MEKKIYSRPLIEVAQVNMSTSVLTGSPEGPVPPVGPAGIVNHRYAPANRTPVF